MEALVTIVEVGAYSERQYQRQDGTAEYFKSREQEPRHPVLPESALYREGLLEAASLGRQQRSS